MAELKDGERVEVEGSTGWYTIARDGDVYSCTCPAWRHQRVAIEMRSCKHVRAFLGDYETVAYEPLYDIPTLVEDEAIRKKREAVVEECLEKYVILYDRFEELTGLRLPEHLAIFVGFFLALSEEEKAWLLKEKTGFGLRGVARWFEEGLVSDTEDAKVRTRDRHATDPVEFFPILDVATGRYGLFYDDSKDLPTATAYIVTQTHARESVTLSEPTPIRSLYAMRRYPRALGYGSYEDEEPGEEKLRETVMAWLGACSKREAKTARSRVSHQRGWSMNGGVTPHIEGWTIPKDLEGWTNQQERSLTYDKTDATAKVEEWLEQANLDLRDGSPGRALLLGRELHWSAAPQWRKTACELLIRSYVALGRRPFADLVQQHYRIHYPDTEVFELPRAHPIVLAAANGDLSGLTEAMKEGDAPSATEVGEALASATTVDAVNALLDLDATQTDSALWRRIGDLDRLKGGTLKNSDMSPATIRKVVRILLTRGQVTARAFGRLLDTPEDDLIEVATGHVDLESHDARGTTALHFAAASAKPIVVKALLERGADATQEDSRGRKPYESARSAWRNHPREAGDIFALLDAAGGGEKKKEEPPPPPEWSAGEKITHSKFGDGVVLEVIEGLTPDERKLKIKFAKKVEKTLLAKFVAKA